MRTLSAVGLMLLMACSESSIEEPHVLLDPGRVDLGPVYPSLAAERKLQIVDLRAFGARTTLRDVQVTGEGADWVSVRPILPLPSNLIEPNVLEVTVRLPAGTAPAPYSVRLSATGDDGSSEFEVSSLIQFDVRRCDEDGDGDGVLACGGGDCDDTDPSISSLATEICNDLDDDCNGFVDDTPDLDGDGYSDCEDCNDTDPEVRPNAPERCNGVDDNCDGEPGLRELDGDGDGVSACEGDCNDLDPNVFPGARELCNGLDDDCDGLLDDAEDADGDSFTVCEDCDDSDRFTFPGAPELCDGLDNDCDGELPTSEQDADGDGVSACERDCDDSDPDVLPGNAESCDGLDQDCDLEIDEDGVCPCDRVAEDGDVYLFCDRPRDWTTARSECAGWGYHLLTIDDSAEDAFAFDEIRDINPDLRWWMGLNDRRVEGTWVWEDGSPVTYTNWGPGEPNDSGGGEDCGQLNRYTDGAWNDEPCSRSLPFVCELD